MNQDETIDDRTATIRELWANKRAAAYQAEEASVQSLQASSAMPMDLSDETVRSTLPRSVLEAYDYYFDQVESADWGSVSVSKEKIQNQDVFAVNVSTDGDDGWAELFDAQGQEIGAARTLLERVAWGELQAIRASIGSSDLPAELQPKPETESNT